MKRMHSRPDSATPIPSAPPSYDSQDQEPLEWSVGHALGVGWDAVKKSPGILVGGFFLVMLVQQVAASIVERIILGPGPRPEDPIEAIQSAGITTPILMVLGVYLGIGQFRVALAAARDEELHMGLFFSGADRLVTGIWLMIIMYSGVLLGLVFLIVPGLIAAMGWSLAFGSLADTDLSAKEALADSWAHTKGQKLKLLLFGFASAGLFLMGLMAFGVGIFIAYPVVMVAFAEIYMCITGRATAQT